MLFILLFLLTMLPSSSKLAADFQIAPCDILWSFSCFISALCCSFSTFTLQVSVWKPVRSHQLKACILGWVINPLEGGEMGKRQTTCTVPAWVVLVEKRISVVLPREMVSLQHWEAVMTAWRVFHAGGIHLGFLSVLFTILGSYFSMSLCVLGKSACFHSSGSQKCSQ